MQQTVATLLNITHQDRVSMGYYPDIVADDVVIPVTASSGMANISGLVGAHAKEIAQGTLAVMSLFMATMMVLKEHACDRSGGGVASRPRRRPRRNLRGGKPCG